MARQSFLFIFISGMKIPTRIASRVVVFNLRNENSGNIPHQPARPGKVCILGHETVAGEEVFILKFLQARNPEWCKRVFFAKYDDKATWLDQLIPAFGEKEFFFEQEYHDIVAKKKTYAKALYQVT